MKHETVVIKQVPDDLAVAHGLEKYGRSKMPGTSDFLQPGDGADGRKITGFDEESYLLSYIEEDDEREKLKEQLKNLRESLEKATGISDLSGKSPYWDTFGVRIFSDKDLTLNKVNPMDVIKYHILVSNGYAAPDFASAGKPEYRNAKYYCYIENNVVAEDVSTQRLRDKARAELLRITENHDHAVLLGQYLEGDKYKAKLSDNSLYKMLSDYINKDVDNLNRFLKASKASIEDLTFKIVIDRAVKRKIITVKEGYYQRGNITFGKKLEEVYSSLKKPENATEFLSIQEEVS